MKVKEGMYVILGTKEHNLYRVIEIHIDRSVGLTNIVNGRRAGTYINQLRPYFLQTGDYILINFQNPVKSVRCIVVDFFFDAGTYFINLKDHKGSIKSFPLDIVEKDFVNYLT